MKAKMAARWLGRLVSWALVLALALSFCTGCGKRNIKPPDGGESDDRGVTDPAPVPDPDPGPDPFPVPVPGDADSLPTNVQVGAEIDALNVVLVIDVSASTLKNDPARNWLEAACMFLHTLYASASQGRLSGSKNAKVGVILYNDAIVSYSDTLMNLKTKATVDELNTFIRYKKAPSGGDDALSEALDRATKILYENSGGEEKLSERSVILLFTDGYTPKGSDSPLSAAPMAAQTGGVSAAPMAAQYGGASSGGAPPYAAYAAMPNFRDSHQALLESALKRANERNYEIIALMLNPNGSDAGGWEQFKAITNHQFPSF